MKRLALILSLACQVQDPTQAFQLLTDVEETSVNCFGVEQGDRLFLLYSLRDFDNGAPFGSRLNSITVGANGLRSSQATRHLAYEPGCVDTDPVLDECHVSNTAVCDEMADAALGSESLEMSLANGIGSSSLCTRDGLCWTYDVRLMKSIEE